MLITERDLEDICIGVMQKREADNQYSLRGGTLSRAMFEEFVKEGRVILEVENATRQKRKQEVCRQEHQDRDESGQAAEASNSDCAIDPAQCQNQGQGRKERPIIYIAGPMTGYADLNFPAFHRAATHWRSCGYSVQNPAEINAVDDGRTDHERRRRDIQALLLCGSIYMLRGWSSSNGAKTELVIAKWLNFTVWYEGE
jgi:hypothetical protein